VLLSHLIAADIAGGHGVIVVDPQGDLIKTTLGLIPEDRKEDVVILDADDPEPVGFNPQAAANRNPEVVADSLLSVFKVLYSEAWGPRTQDILHAAGGPTVRWRASCPLTSPGKSNGSSRDSLLRLRTNSQRLVKRTRIKKDSYAPRCSWSSMDTCGMKPLKRPPDVTSIRRCGAD
jgi:hypothetical protein